MSHQDIVYHGHFVSVEATAPFSCCVLWKEAINCILLLWEAVASAELLRVLSLGAQPPA